MEILNLHLPKADPVQRDLQGLRFAANQQNYMLDNIKEDIEDHEDPTIDPSRAKDILGRVFSKLQENGTMSKADFPEKRFNLVIPTKGIAFTEEQFLIDAGLNHIHLDKKKQDRAILTWSTVGGLVCYWMESHPEGDDGYLLSGKSSFGIIFSNVYRIYRYWGQIGGIKGCAKLVECQDWINTNEVATIEYYKHAEGKKMARKIKRAFDSTRAELAKSIATIRQGLNLYHV